MSSRESEYLIRMPRTASRRLAPVSVAEYFVRFTTLARLAVRTSFQKPLKSRSATSATTSNTSKSVVPLR